MSYRSCSLLILLVSVLCSATAATTTLYNLTANVWQQIIVPSSGKYAEVIATTDPAATTMETRFYACYGPFTVTSWFVASQKTNLWTPTTTEAQFSTYLKNMKGSVSEHFGVTGSGTTGTTAIDAAAIVEVVFANEASGDWINAHTPKPGATNNNDATITASVAKDGTSATISWFATDDSTDSYKVYRLDVDKSVVVASTAMPTGYFYSACSVKLFMAPDTEATSRIAQTSNVYSVTLTGMSKSTITLVTVVVEKNQGYQAIYTPIQLNAAPRLASVGLVFLLSLLLTLLF